MSTESKQNAGIGVPLKRLVSWSVGDTIEWTECHCPVRGGIKRVGVVIAQRGRNIEVDTGGTRDWKHLDDIRHIRKVSAANDEAERTAIAGAARQPGI